MRDDNKDVSVIGAALKKLEVCAPSFLSLLTLGKDSSNH